MGACRVHNFSGWAQRFLRVRAHIAAAEECNLSVTSGKKLLEYVATRRERPGEKCGSSRGARYERIATPAPTPTHNTSAMIIAGPICRTVFCLTFFRRLAIPPSYPKFSHIQSKNYATLTLRSSQRHCTPHRDSVGERKLDVTNAQKTARVGADKKGKAGQHVRRLPAHSYRKAPLCSTQQKLNTCVA